MEKFEKDGKIAVLISPGYGAGWSTWASDNQKEALCMDARIIGAFIDGGEEAAVKAALKMFPDVYTGGSSTLEVEWVEKGTVFEIREYDGSESLNIIGSQSYYRA